MNDYLIETQSIDYNDENIQKKVGHLKELSSDDIDYIERCFMFVRDEIPHSWDINASVVSKKASEVLANKTGVCWTKSCLLAALLRANEIPSGISYQLLTRADDASDGYIIHAFNTVYIEQLDKWIRLDARGNKENVNAQFSLDEEHLAYEIRSEMGEIDYRNNQNDLDERLVNVLSKCNVVSEIRTDFEF